MNMERAIPKNDPQQVPSSPKKKLHTKENGCSLADTIVNARASLKNGKDISARNLLECGGASTVRKPPSRGPSLEFDPSLANDCSESSVEEIVALDEDHTDFASTCQPGDYDLDDDDDDETIVEEIIEEYYEEELVHDDVDDDDTEDSELEPLPPPIVIPKSLQVKDSDDEDEDDEDEMTLEDDDDDDDRKSSIVVQPMKQKPSPVVLPTTKTSNQTLVTADSSKALKESTKDAKELVERNAVVSVPMVFPTPAKVPVASSTEHQAQPITLESPTRSITAGETDVTVSKSYREVENDMSVVANEANNGIAWEKPDWTKNNRLKSTGVSPSRNLARPITSLPQLAGSNANDECKTPKKSNSMRKLPSNNATKAPPMQIPKSPQLPTKTADVVSMNAPKSAPQLDGGRKKFALPTGSDENESDEFNSKIAWEKPEWAKKKVLRKTSKTETILSGGKLERPIGGIRPIE